MQIKINKRSAYAPIRYEATRPYAAQIGKTFMMQAQKGPQARMAFVQHLMPLLKSAVGKMGTENGPGPVQAEMGNVQAFGGFQDAGKVIFDVAPSLTASLSLTDADEIPCGELVLPCKAFYVHFGKDTGLMADGYEVEGAFVHHAEGRLMVDLVPKGWAQPHFFILPMGEPLIGVSIDITTPEKPLASALTDSIRTILEGNARILAQVAELEKQLTKQYGEVVKVPSPVEQLGDKESLLRKALGLIVNVTFYLAAEPTDSVSDWGRDTPSEAIAALHAAKGPGETKTIENTLRNAGYSKVRMVGRAFAESVASREVYEAISSGRTVATHFRRGHFKRQPYGPERSLRKTIFVSPVVVNASIGGPQPGRIYEVK